MKFSAQEEYGLRCLLAIAKQASESGVTIPEIARAEGLSQPHAAKLLGILRREGFVLSTRGQLGGYALARDPSRIVVADVLTALGGRMFEAGFCERHTGVFDECTHEIDCSLRSLWREVQNSIDQVLRKVTLKDLMDRKTDPEDRIIFQAAPPPRLARGGKA